MIRLTRLNGQEFWMNADMIEQMESTPDTVLVLVDGRKIIVQEAPIMVAQMCVSFRAAILMAAGGAVLEEAMLTHGAHEALRNKAGQSPGRPATVEIEQPGQAGYRS